MKDQLTKNFNVKEFSCNDQFETPVPEELYDNVKLLAEQLQIIRNCLNEKKDNEIKIVLNSGYRTPAYNKRIKGARRSQHMKAQAADMNATDYNPISLMCVILGLMEDGKIIQGGLKAYSSFVHYDIRGKRTLF